jgi:hypothetical protein
VKVVDMFTKKQEFIPPEKWHMFEDDGSRVPAIIDSETWEKANQYLLERSNMIKSHRSSYKNENIFTGKIFCANDGAMYWLKSRVIHGHEDIKWVCSHKLKYGSSTCSSFYVDELELKKMLVDMIRSSVQTIDGIVEQYWEIYSRVISDHMVDNSAQIQRLNREIDALNKKKDKILDYSLNGIISDQEFARRNNDFNEQIKSLEEQVKELSHDPTESMELRKKLSCIKKMIREYADITTSDITKTVVNDMIERINITPIGDHAANIEFILKNGATSMALYDKNHMIRSDYMFKNMSPEMNIEQNHTIEFPYWSLAGRYHMPVRGLFFCKKWEKPLDLE